MQKSNPNHGAQGHFAAGHKGERKLGHAAHLRAVFKDATNSYVGKEITNKATGIKAVFSKESQKEIGGNTGLSKTNGFGIAKHFEVANQVIELFENATLESEHADAKHGDKNVSIERFLSQPVTLKSGETAQACITVKHTRNPDGRNLYSLEAMSVENALEKTRAKGQHPASSEASPLSPAASISKALEKTSGKPLHPRFMLRKSVADEICRFWGLPLVKAYNPRDPQFEYFKRKILAHLTELERQEKNEMRKSLAYLERLEKAERRTYNVGEIATWKNGKFIKGADKKWRRYYEGHSKQAESTITRLKGRARKCQNSSELWDLVVNNWGRFMDTDKMPLPIVREFHQYVSTIEDEINAGVSVENRTAHRPKRKRSPSGAKHTANEGGVSDSTTNIARTETSQKDDYIDGAKPFTEEIKNEVIEQMKNTTTKIKKVEYSRENYNSLFPEGKITTPLGVVKMGEHQFERLEAKDGKATRRDILGAIYQTLSEPDVIIKDMDSQGRASRLFIKALVDTRKQADESKARYIVSIVPTMDGLRVSVSNGLRKAKDVEKKIKCASIYYYKAEGGGAFTGTVQNTDVAQPSKIVPQSAENASEKDLEQSIGKELEKWSYSKLFNGSDVKKVFDEEQNYVYEHSPEIKKMPQQIQKPFIQWVLPGEKVKLGILFCVGKSLPKMTKVMS